MEFPLAPPTQPGKILPLSLSQREVWLDQMAWPGSSHLNIGGGGFLVGSLDTGKFRAALSALVEETEALRLVPLADGRQFLLSSYTSELTELDFTQEAAPKQAMIAWWQNKIKEPFPPDGRPPWRFILLKGSDEFHGLTIQFHHLIMDGWGTTQIMNRWSTLYNSLMKPASSKPEKSPGYLQFIEESNAYRNSPSFIKDGQYWSERLPVVPQSLIEQRHPPQHAGLPTAHIFNLGIAHSDYVRLGEFAKERGYTPFSVVLAAIAIYFARTRNRTQVTIGIPTLNRAGNRYIETPGMFVGVMPITVEINPVAPIESIITTAHRALREAMRHPRYPLSELSRSLKILRDKRSGLFDVLLSFERQDYSISFGAARLIDSKQLFSATARYPLGITLCEFEIQHDLEMILEGSSACFANGEVELLARRLWHLVLGIMSAPKQTFLAIDIVPAEERWALLDGLHQTLACHDGAQSFVTLFEHQARLRPDAIALTWQGGSMSYCDLERRSRALAHSLSKHISGRDVIIAMALEREPEMVVALLAIARARAAFLPLDPDAPLARLSHILAASGAAVLLIQTRNRGRLSSLHEHALEIDSILAHPDAPESEPLTTPRSEDLAYVLYTSGSTGEPKGVMIEHGALAIRLAWLSRNYRVTSSDRSAQATQYTFDPALIEICLPLIHGASVALPPPGRLSAKTLADFVVAQDVTIMAFVPSTLERFLDALGDTPSPDLKLRVACCGGEILPTELANRFLHMTGGQLFNVYGPTETVIFSTAWPCRPASIEKPLPIGRCIDNTRIYILDANLGLLPIWERGEICIGGGAVARGYLKHPELDRMAFFDDPFVPGARLYRTGDSGWLDGDGNLHFCGRLDRQIKLRGYRIEPGEIESALLAMEGVVRAAVKTVILNKQQVLHAWVVAGSHIDANNLREHLVKRLPDYMLPGSFSFLPSLPETLTGKIDFAALPSPEERQAVAYPRKPAPGLESVLIELWTHALGKQVESVTENFFELGGDSLAVINIITGIEKLLGRKVPLYLVTENPTIESLARALAKIPQKNQPLLRLGGEPGLPPLFLIASGHGDLIRFRALAAALAQSFDLYMLQPPDHASTKTLGDLASLYADQIRMHGVSQVYLAGFSVGGITGLETSRVIQNQGINVGGLVLIDTLYPNALLRARRLWQFFGWLTKRLHVQDLSMNGRRIGALFSDAGLVIQIQALWEYEPTEYPGPALLVKSSGLVFWQRWLFNPWRRIVTDRLTEMEAPGLHGSMFEPGNIGSLAAILKGFRPGSNR